MGDEEDNFRRLELAESLQEVLASIMVEPGGGFVEEEHRGIGGQGASQSQTLPLPHAELRATVEEAAEEEAPAEEPAEEEPAEEAPAEE